LTQKGDLRTLLLAKINKKEEGREMRGERRGEGERRSGGRE
jgi:hypothetical protein